MNKNKTVLAALAMDLKRSALGAHRGSKNSAKRFMVEAIKRRGEVNQKDLPEYMRALMTKIGLQIKAEDALMFSTIIQNYVLAKKLTGATSPTSPTSPATTARKSAS